MTTQIYEVLYASVITPGVPFSAIGLIARKSRVSNLADNITGLLVFDGMRFSQQLEGGETEVLALLDSIRQDSRHINFKLLHQGPVAERRFKNFSLAYALMEDVDVLGRLQKLKENAAMDAFVALLPTLDLDIQAKN